MRALMSSRPVHRRSASLFALLLFVPLIHGAGAHLGDLAAAVHAAEDLAKPAACHSADVAAEMSAPARHRDPHAGLHATADFCSLCVTARSAWNRPVAELAEGPVITGPILARDHDDSLRSNRPGGRPEAPRAPPRHVA